MQLRLARSHPLLARHKQDLDLVRDLHLHLDQWSRTLLGQGWACLRSLGPAWVCLCLLGLAWLCLRLSWFAYVCFGLLMACLGVALVCVGGFAWVCSALIGLLCAFWFGWGVFGFAYVCLGLIGLAWVDLACLAFLGFAWACQGLLGDCWCNTVCLGLLRFVLAACVCDLLDLDRIFMADYPHAFYTLHNHCRFEIFTFERCCVMTLATKSQA